VARTGTDEFPTPSLVDRLSVDEPDYAGSSSDEVARRRVIGKSVSREAQEHFEDTVRRDLEWLFNTRRVKDERLDRWPGLLKSVYNYGLPDVSSADPSRQHDQDALLKFMEEAIERFDPRLRDWHIQFAPAAGAAHMLRFQIDGVVLMDPSPAEVSFETLVDRTNGECKVNS
jgi:type VI secretion system protein ImpF